MPYPWERPQPRRADPFGAFNSRVTYYAPGPGDRMEGGFETSQPNPGTGQRRPSTLDDVRLGTSPYVTLAGDPSRYGQTIKMGPQTYTSPIDRKTYTLPDVTGYVHDTGSAFRGRPDKLDVATGDFRGWSPQQASAFVTADAGHRTVTPLEGDEANRAMRPIGMPEPWRATGAGESPTDTAVASGPPPPARGQATQGRKMPSSLMDMFQPQDAAGQPVGFGDAVTGRSNSLIGLGLGLLSPSNPLRGQSGWGQGLEGYMAGSALDARQATSKAALAHQKTQDARQAAMDQFHRSQAAQTQANFERQFARGDPANAVSPAQTAMRDVLGPDATPEQKSAFMQDFYRSKTEGNLAAQADQRRAIAEKQGLDPNDPKVKYWIAGGGALNEEGKPLPAEMASRIALGGKFLDEAPAIRAKIETGMATDTLGGKVKTYFNAGEQGEVSRKVKSGTDALLRSLTGAGMPDAEARKYVARYEIQPTDTKETALSKFDQLHDELGRAEQEAFRGRGGIPRDVTERRKAAHEKATTATAPGPKTPPPPKAGHVEDGHVFKGGDPSDPNNWAVVR